MLPDEERAQLGLAYCSRYLHLTRKVIGLARNSEGKGISGTQKGFRVPLCGTKERLTHVDPDMGPQEGPQCPDCYREVYGVELERQPKGRKGGLPAQSQPYLPGFSP